MENIFKDQKKSVSGNKAFYKLSDFTTTINKAIEIGNLSKINIRFSGNLVSECNQAN